MGTGMKLSFTDIEYDYARKQASALDYALSQGYDLVKAGKDYRLREHDSMVFTADGKWFWNSRGLRGGPIEFAMYYENKTLPEAVLSICNAHSSGSCYYKRKTNERADAKSKDRKFELPPVAKFNYKLVNYLCTQRGLDRLIVQSCINAGTIYQTIYRYPGRNGTVFAQNAVFVGRDLDGVPRSAFLRSLVDGPNIYRGDVGQSNAQWPFVLHASRRKADSVVVFESAIDALSHATIYKLCNLPAADCYRISINGVTKHIGLLNFLETHPNIRYVWLAFDEDCAGQQAREKVTQIISDKYKDRYEVNEIHSPEIFGKDWNEYLKKWRDVLSAVDWNIKYPSDVGLAIAFDDSGKPTAVRKYYDKEKFIDTALTGLLTGERIVMIPAQHDDDEGAPTQ